MSSPGTAQEGTQELSIPEARAVAVAAHRAQEPVIARDLALALLERDPTDSVALQVLAASSYALGDYDQAAAAGRRAYRTAGTDGESHDAAMIVAEALFRQERATPARFWLRRAAQYAPTPELRAMAVESFRGLGERQKLRTRLDFGITPSNNVNGGSSSDTLVLNGIPFLLSPDTQALSGIEARIGLSGSYRISESSSHATEIGASAFARVHRLSDSARRAAPEADAADYAFAAVETFISHRFRPATAKGPYDVTFTLGKNWYGGDPLSDYARFGLGHEFPLSDRHALRLETSVERQWRKDFSERSADVLTLGAFSQRLLGSGDRLSLGVELRETASDSVEIDHSAISLSAGYAWTNPIGPAQISSSFAAEARDYTQSRYSPGGRQDVRFSAGLSLLLTNYDYYGFAPQIDLRASRTESNISLYDSNDLGVSLGLRSIF